MSIRGGDDAQCRQEVAQRLQRYDLGRNSELAARYTTTQYPHTRRCAVLVPLFVSPRDGQLYVLLTKRASNLRHQASHVAFPGGAQDSTDRDDTHTALREAHEEIGLPPQDVTVLAHIPPTFVRPVNVVFPVVAFIPATFQPRPNPHEVAMTFSLPLRRFLESKATPFPFVLKDRTYLTFTLTHSLGDTTMAIWGMTCTVCVLVARAIYGPYRRVRLIQQRLRQGVGKSEAENGADTHVDEDGDNNDHDNVDDDDVFGDLEIMFHYFCQSTRPVGHL